MQTVKTGKHLANLEFEQSSENFHPTDLLLLALRHLQQCTILHVYRLQTWLLAEQGAYLHPTPE